MSGALGQALPGAFQVSAVGDRAQAESAVRVQRAYGAIVVGPTGAEVLVTSARSPVVAQLLTQVGAKLGAAQQVAVTTTDVVPCCRATRVAPGWSPVCSRSSSAGWRAGRRHHAAAATGLAGRDGGDLRRRRRFRPRGAAAGYWLGC